MVKANRYLSTVVAPVGFAILLLGIFYQPHRFWLQDCGGLIVALGMGLTVLTLRPHVRDFAPTMRRVQRLCDHAGVPFGFANGTYRWHWPFTFTASLVQVSFLAADLILNTQHRLLHYVSDASAFLCSVGVVIILTRTGNVETILRKIEQAAHSGKIASSPPTAAKLILLLIPKRHRENLVGDLEEEYVTILLPEYGAKIAQLWYWWQVVLSVRPLLWAQVKRWAAIAWLWKRVR